MSQPLPPPPGTQHATIADLADALLLVANSLARFTAAIEGQSPPADPWLLLPAAARLVRDGRDDVPLIALRVTGYRSVEVITDHGEFLDVNNWMTVRLGGAGGQPVSDLAERRAPL